MTTAVKERPILFSGPMVQAILDGRKTQTRRVVKWKPVKGGGGYNFLHSSMSAGHYCTGVPSSGHVLYSRRGDGCWEQRTRPVHCPYGQPGERLWVRETWASVPFGPHREWPGVPDLRPRKPSEFNRACSIIWRADGEMPEPLEPWRPSIHMPRWASRITLEITGVRVERLHDISEADKEAEGATADRPFGTVWRKINTKPGVRWDDNPWVWALEFRRVETA